MEERSLDMPAIRTEQLTKRFGQVYEVDQLNLEVEEGELFGFLGPNGAGKTTTINMLTGIIRPTAGRAYICGHDVWKTPHEAKQITGLMPDHPNIYETLTGRQFVRCIADMYEIDPHRAEQHMERLFEQLELTNDADELIRSYSYGMRKKVILIALLVQEAEVLFLDEPTSGLDPRSARVARELLRGFCEQGGTVFMTTHVLDIAERMCDRVGIIHQGKLIAVGTLDDLRGQETSDLSLEDIFLKLTESEVATEPL